MGDSPPTIGIFGGSGFEKLLDDSTLHDVDTPWGHPATPIAVGELAGRNIAFLPRHGLSHEYPPHTIPYRANVWAMKQLGVRRLLAPCAAGSLQREIAPGHFVVCDQLVDRTKLRGDTFHDDPPVTHVSFADPYCPQLRPLAIKACRTHDVDVHETGTVVVIEGPRFATKAESKFFTRQGWHVVNMTQYPEAVLAREAEMCYVNISLITDYDSGLSLDSDFSPVSVEEIIAVFNNNNDRLVSVLAALIASIPDGDDDPGCPCMQSLDGAQL